VDVKPVYVMAQQESYKVSHQATTATKTDTPIMETPFSIQVVPQQVLKDQQTTRLDHALNNVSGVFANQSLSLFESFTIRGFETFDYYREGTRFQSALTQTGRREMANLERIEVLKGPASILYGRIQPGGMINLVTKKPLGGILLFDPAAGRVLRFLPHGLGCDEQTQRVGVAAVSLQYVL
jgi:outer membrane receptor protein involved in Fe transport